MAGGQITGVVGQIKWSYYVAAAINGYTVTRTPENTWRLRGTVVLSDAFKLAKQPLMFVAPHRLGGVDGEWRWPILEMEMADGSLTAKLGPPVE
jgi:hypothetical protein